MSRTLYVFAHFLLFTVAGCDDALTVDPDARVQNVARTFGADDRRAAKALSIGGDALAVVAEPYDRAVLCVVVLENITARLEADGALTTDSRQAMSQAKINYERRAASFGKSDAQRMDDRRAVKAAHPEAGDRAKLAIGCLRELT